MTIEPTKEQIEAGAKAAYEMFEGRCWQSLDDHTKAELEVNAEAVLRAAQNVSPPDAASIRARAFVDGMLAACVWIKTSERLPEEGVRVLVNIGDGDVAWRIGNCWVNDNWHRDRPLEDATHWMPIPPLGEEAPPDERQRERRRWMHGKAKN